MALTSVQTLVSYYDAQGALLEQRGGYGGMLSTVGPGETVAAYSFGPKTAVRHTVDLVVGEPTAQVPNRNFRVISVSWPDRGVWGKFIDVEVTNLNRTTATRVSMQVICFNDGRVYAFHGPTFPTDMAPGQTSVLSQIVTPEVTPCEVHPMITIDATSDPTVPIAVPSPPPSASATPGSLSASLTWSAPDSNGGPISGYIITASPGGQTWSMSGAQTDATLTGLAAGTSYQFRVAATNAAGTGAPAVTAPVVPNEPPSPVAVPVVTPAPAPTARVPGRVARPTASVKGRSVTVRWRPPPTHGAPVTGYTVRSSAGKTIRVGPGRRWVTFQRHAVGAYRFRVVAQSRVGSAPASRAVKARVRG
ncbi:fibronectin type III domain-containing protein [Nocardioides sp. P5_E3]